MKSKKSESNLILILYLLDSLKSFLSLKKSVEEHFNRSNIFLLYFYDTDDVILARRKVRQNKCLTEFHHLMKKVRWPTSVTAKEKNFRQKKNFRGKRKMLARKNKLVTAKEKSSQQMKNSRAAKKKFPLQKKNARGKKK